MVRHEVGEVLDQENTTEKGDDMRLIKLETPTSNMYSASYVSSEMIKTINVEKSGMTHKVWVDAGAGANRLLWFTSTKTFGEVLREIEENLSERVRDTKTF